MNEKLIEAEDLKSVLKEVGIQSEESNQCIVWTSPKLDEPLTNADKIVAELTPEEQGFFRCMGYAHEEKVVDTVRLKALYETFWILVRSFHDLPSADLAIKEGKYVVSPS